jgi:hypothetical protein
MSRKGLMIWIRVSAETLWSAIRALKEQSSTRHHEARLEEDQRSQLEKRAEGDWLNLQSEQLRRAMMRGRANEPEDAPDKGNGDE